MRYQYTECGLDNVVVVGLDPVLVVDGERGVGFPRVGRLHRAIAEALIARPGQLSGREMRFLRTEAGLTPAELARRLGCSESDIARWEADGASVSDRFEAATRNVVAAELDLSSPRATVATGPQRGDAIVIDGSDPARYRVLDAERIG